MLAVQVQTQVQGKSHGRYCHLDNSHHPEHNDKCCGNGYIFISKAHNQTLLLKKLFNFCMGAKSANNTVTWGNWQISLTIHVDWCQLFFGIGITMGPPIVIIHTEAGKSHITSSTLPYGCTLFKYKCMHVTTNGQKYLLQHRLFGKFDYEFANNKNHWRKKYNFSRQRYIWTKIFHLVESIDFNFYHHCNI